MIKYLETDEWKIIEKGFNPIHHRSSESIFSIGNGRFGQRTSFEEDYSGKSLQGSYIAGIYYPDKTRVGWWKNGYPEYFAKVLNSTNWIGIRVRINDEELDLATCEVRDFERCLDMKRGVLERSFIATLKSGIEVKIKALRFCSMADDETAAISYEVTALNSTIEVRFESYLDSNVRNKDSNYDHGFWDFIDGNITDNSGTLVSRTMKTKFELGVSMVNECSGQEKALECHHSSNYASCSFSVKCHRGEKVAIRKYVGIATSLDYKASDVGSASLVAAERASNIGFEAMLEAQSKFWESIWQTGDIRIEGDAEAQQGIRFNIFQLNQTYTGNDERFNIGPKGFTGEKYGGSTYWDTEAYCLPFYLNTRDSKVARQLLVYRYRHLEKAIENAGKLGFHSGAALYPMVTMNGEECHNEWEITFEEIHRNGAIAYAIFNYVRHTGDKAYLAEYGFDVLLGISRFWAQRVNWSEQKQAFVMLGVTGPNEYENNVNNNWYTNYIATWCLRYTIECFEYLKSNYSNELIEKSAKYNFDAESEIQNWQNIIANMYYPVKEGSDIVLQQDGFLDKEINPVSSLSAAERPINQHWSWDRILRSVYIKQADVLQGMYFFEHEFSKEKIKANFDFYEPLTVHESSLSPCVHVILAAALNYEAKAYELYLRTSRLDLDDYNHEAHEGLHITSMAGTWLSVVEGFGGLRYHEEGLRLNPVLPAHWKSLGFKIRYRNHLLDITINHQEVKITNNHSESITIELNGKQLVVPGNV